MRRNLGISALILFALIVQTTILPHLALFHVVPDLLLLVVICIGLVQGPSAGAVSGFLAGLLRDFLLSSPTGLSSLAYLGVGYAVGAVRPYVQSSSVVVPLVGVFVGTAAGTSAFITLSILLGVPAEPVSRLAQVVLLTSLYNTLLVPFAYPVVRRLTADPHRMEAAMPGSAQ